MKKLEFNPSDFDHMGDTLNCTCNLDYEQNFAAGVAQAKFDEWFKQIENAPLVYIEKGLHGDRVTFESPGEYSTHTARLVDIQEIKKKCEHKNKIYGHKYCAPWAKCNDCGVELVADWREK